MRITTRIHASLGTMVALVVLLALGGFWGLRTAEKVASYFPDKLLPGVRLVLSTDANIERYARLLAGQPVAGKTIDSLRSELDEQMKQIEAIGTAGADPEVKSSTISLADEWKKLRSIDAKSESGLKDALQHVLKLEESMANTGKIIKRLSDDGSSKIISAIDMFGTMVLIGGLVASILAIGISLVLGAAITRPLGALEKTMRNIADTNDLTHRADASSKDEFGQMAYAFNEMVQKLQVLVKRVATSANEVSGSARQLTNTAQMLNHSSEQQSSSVSSNAASIEELTVSIASVADTASDVRRQAGDSVDKTGEGNRKVTELVSEIGTIQVNVNQIAAAVEEFVKSTSAITGMTQEVREIADQTNLLALNAAIEAARAGEQGRGFAVVADEVRKLAEKSGSSAGEIDGVAKTIIQQSDQVRAAIDAGLRSIQASAGLAAAVEGTLSHARESVEHASKGVQEIAYSVAEQKTASTEIAQNMERIANAADESRDAVNGMSQAASALSNSADELTRSISGFRV